MPTSGSKTKTLYLASFLVKKKKVLATIASTFFSSKKACQTKIFCVRVMKNCQHQHKGKPHTQQKNLGVLQLQWRMQLQYLKVSTYGAHCITGYF
jgi:hypothetical protein